MPYYFLLIAYGLVILAGVVYFSINLFHLMRFGFFDFTARLNTTLVVSVFIIVLIFSVVFLSHVNWGEALNFSPNLTVDRI